jgi:NAD(P)-dependent dehydrogenase (short-subunit alcohol dehydrogenase family)
MGLKGVRVNAIGPGWFHSEMTEGLFSDEKNTRFVENRTPMGRAGSPDELLGPLLLLASDAGSFITGQSVMVDGGWTII